MKIEKHTEISLNKIDTEILEKAITLLEMIETGFNDCDEFNLNGNFYNVMDLEDTIQVLKEFYHSSIITGYLEQNC